MGAKQDSGQLPQGRAQGGGRAIATEGQVSAAPIGEAVPELLAPVYSEPATLITTPAQLLEAVAFLRQAQRMAVDLEADSLYHYFDKVCLVQITARGQDFIIDPLILDDLSPLAPLFADPAIEKIFHAADNDVALLHRSFGFETHHVFDTMVAAQIIGLRQFGLGHLLAVYLQLHIDKSLQRHDWSARPLLPAHLAYARSDTHFLEVLRDRLEGEVRALGRMDQLQEELSLVAGKRLISRTFNPDDCLKLTGASVLEPKVLRLLRELFILRDTIARSEDVPVFRVIPNEVLVHLAQTPVMGNRDLYRVSGLHPRVIKRYGNELMAAIRRGQNPNAQLPRQPRKEPRPVHQVEIEARFQLLRRWRQKKAEELNQDLAVVASNTILQAVATVNPTSLEALAEVHGVRQWQVTRFGREWLQLLRPHAAPGGAPLQTSVNPSEDVD